MKRMLASTLILTFILCAGLIVSNDTASASATLTAATCPDYPPFEYYNNGHLSGIDIEIARTVAEKMGCSIQFQEMSFDEIFVSVESGQSDLCISAIIATEERRSVLDFTVPYITVDGQSYRVGFPKGSAYFSGFNAALSSLIADGTIAKIAEKYGFEDATPDLSDEPDPTPMEPDPDLIPGLDPNYAGVYSVDGVLAMVQNGKIDANAEGLVNDPAHPSDWYYCSAGVVHTELTSVVLYDGAWFYVTNGKLDTTFAGFVEYNGERFAVGAGRILSEAQGLVQDPVSKAWFYCSDGRVQSQVTGLAQYDGAWFYISHGQLDESFTGEVEYDGARFNVVNGMLVA